MDEGLEQAAQASMPLMAVTQITRQAAKKLCNMTVSNFMAVLRELGDEAFEIYRARLVPSFNFPEKPHSKAISRHGAQWQKLSADGCPRCPDSTRTANRKFRANRLEKSPQRFRLCAQGEAALLWMSRKCL